VQSGEFADSKIVDSVLLEPTRLREKSVQANDAVVEIIVFPNYFSICVISVMGAARPVSFVSMVVGQSTKARCFAIKGATYQPW